MSAFQFHKPSTRQLLYWILIVLGLVLVVWQFFTFMAVVEGHTAHAQNTSRYASWAGQPVGTMPQPPANQVQGVVRVQHDTERNVGMMRADQR